MLFLSVFRHCIFEFYGVDVTGEDIVVPGPTDVLTAANLYRMGYV